MVNVDLNKKLVESRKKNAESKLETTTKKKLEKIRPMLRRYLFLFSTWGIRKGKKGNKFQEKDKNPIQES